MIECPDCEQPYPAHQLAEHLVEDHRIYDPMLITPTWPPPAQPRQVPVNDSGVCTYAR